jgi:hypothetical protein
MDNRRARPARQGRPDRYGAHPRALADTLANARYTVVPGDHMSAVTKPDLGAAIADFLDDPATP